MGSASVVVWLYMVPTRAFVTAPSGGLAGVPFWLSPVGIHLKVVTIVFSIFVVVSVLLLVVAPLVPWVGWGFGMASASGGWLPLGAEELLEGGWAPGLAFLGTCACVDCIGVVRLGVLVESFVARTEGSDLPGPVAPGQAGESGLPDATLDPLGPVDPGRGGLGYPTLGKPQMLAPLANNPSSASPPEPGEPGGPNNPPGPDNLANLPDTGLPPGGGPTPNAPNQVPPAAENLPEARSVLVRGLVWLAQGYINTADRLIFIGTEVVLFAEGPLAAAVDAGRILFRQHLMWSLWARGVTAVAPGYGSLLSWVSERQQAFAANYNDNIYRDGQLNWAAVPSVFISGLESVGMSMFFATGLSALLGTTLAAVWVTGDDFLDLQEAMGEWMYPAGLLLLSWTRPTSGSVGVEFASWATPWADVVLAKVGTWVLARLNEVLTIVAPSSVAAAVREVLTTAWAGFTRMAAWYYSRLWRLGLRLIQMYKWLFPEVSGFGHWWRIWLARFWQGYHNYCDWVAPKWRLPPTSHAGLLYAQRLQVVTEPQYFYVPGLYNIMQGGNAGYRYVGYRMGHIWQVAPGAGGAITNRFAEVKVSPAVVHPQTGAPMAIRNRGDHTMLAVVPRQNLKEEYKTRHHPLSYILPSSSLAPRTLIWRQPAGGTFKVPFNENNLLEWPDVGLCNLNPVTFFKDGALGQHDGSLTGYVVCPVYKIDPAWMRDQFPRYQQTHEAFGWLAPIMRTGETDREHVQGNEPGPNIPYIAASFVIFKELFAAIVPSADPAMFTVGPLEPRGAGRE